jgi:hypothetical protein
MLMMFWMAWLISASGMGDLGREPTLTPDRATAISRVM